MIYGGATLAAPLASGRQTDMLCRQSMGIESLFSGYWEGYKGKGVMKERERKEGGRK